MAEVKRMRYFDGLFLKQEEFNLEQNYHIRMRRLHNRHLHTQGIVWGLDVKVESGKVVVEPGMAINAVGGSQDEGNENEDISQEIVLADPVSLSLSVSEVQNGVYIYVYFKKEAADEVPDRGGTEKIHWAEKALIDRDPSRSNSENEGKIILARVQNSSGTIDDAHIFYTDKDGTTPLRTYAGAYGKLTLSIEKETYEPLIEGKKIDGKNGILVTSQITKFSGALSIKEGITGGLHIGGTSDPGDKNLVVDGNCTIYGNLDVRGDTTTIETKTLEVEDNVVIVNKYPSQPTPKVINGGLEVFRGGTAKNAQVIWDETADKWKIGLEDNLADVAYGASWVALTNNSVANTLHRHSKIVSADGVVDPALNVDNSGNVGIGIANAENGESWGKVLDILGQKNVKLSVRTTGTAGIDARVLAHDSGWWGAPAGMIIGTNTAHPLSFGTASVARMTIDGSGRVCIGTSAAARKLQVDGDVLINAGSPAGNAGLEILGKPGSWGPSVAVNNGKQEWRIATGDDNSLKFVKITGTAFTPFTINNTSFQDALVLAASGVGIGTAAPSEKLEVNGRIKAAAFIGDGSLITNLPIGQWFTNTKGIYYDKGYVGIGTKNPGANLEVKSGESIFRASDLAPDDFIKINATNETATTLPPVSAGPITSATGPAISAATLGTIPTATIGTRVTPTSTTGTTTPVMSTSAISTAASGTIPTATIGTRVTPTSTSGTTTPVMSAATLATPVISTAAASAIASLGAIGGTPVAGGPIIQFYEANTQKANLWWKRGGAFLINSVGSTNTSINPNGGNVGIGTASPSVRLSIGGTGANVYATDAWIENNMHVQGNETLAQGGRGRMRVGTAWGYMGLYADPSSTGVNNDLVLGASSGNVRIGPDTVAQNLKVSGNILVAGNRTFLNGLDSSGNHWIMAGGTVEGTNSAISLNPNTKKFSVGPGWAKAFMAHHPLDPENKYLTHSTLEGPENAVFYRGEAELSEGRTTIQLPDYFEALTRKENRTVLITPKFEGDSPVSMLAASEVDDGKFDVKMIDRKNPSQKFYWEVKAVRADIGILDVEEQKLPAQ